MKVFLLTDCLINRDGADISVWPNGGFDELLHRIESEWAKAPSKLKKQKPDGRLCVRLAVYGDLLFPRYARGGHVLRPADDLALRR